MNSKNSNRFLIVLGTIIMQMGLGTIYTWSLFNAPLVTKFGWELSSVSITFPLQALRLPSPHCLRVRFKKKWDLEN